MRNMRVFGVLCLFIMLCAAGWAQSTAQMHGTVQDSSGSGVPGAEVNATQLSTGLVRTTVSGADGSWVLTNLPLGPYRLEVSKEASRLMRRPGSSSRSRATRWSKSR